MCKRILHPVWHLSIALAIFAVAACDSNSSPVAPSVPCFSGVPGPSASFGATIQGQVNGLGGTGATSLRSSMAGDAVMIEVLGTEVMDDVDPNGQFVLVGVAGSPNVVLRISSSTMDVTISLGEVREDETVTVTLAVVGNDVEMVSETRDSDDKSPDDGADDSSSDDDDSVDDDSSDTNDSIDDNDTIDDDRSDDDSDDDDDSADEDNSGPGNSSDDDDD